MEVLAIVTAEIALAKNVLAMHSVDELGKPVLVLTEGLSGKPGFLRLWGSPYMTS
jgi:hypothetical protein